MRIVVLAAGTYGDVPPCGAQIGVTAADHRVCIATHTEIEALVTSRDLECVV
jgi:UDP:flavonoid glycosyltransferase YjiC (YdhE family)